MVISFKYISKSYNEEFFILPSKPKPKMACIEFSFEIKKRKTKVLKFFN